MKLILLVVSLALSAYVGICQELEWGDISTEQDLEHTECRSGWEEFGDKCYFFSTNSVDWYEARDHCKRIGAYLTEIDRSDENDFLKRIAGKERGNYYWTGGNDLISKGHWYWDHSSSPMRFVDWYPGEPNNKGIERCMDLERRLSFRWNNLKCGTHCNFICEANRY